MPQLIKLCLLALCTCLAAVSHAWVNPVDLNADNGDAIEGDPTHEVGGVIRCDTPTDYFNSPEEIPDACHRWNLVWHKTITDPVTDWKTSGDAIVGEGKRLPTIKELIKLYDYSSGNGLGLNPIIESYLPDADVNNRSWLLSSSYRDIDGTDSSDSDRTQILAINISTGEVQVFEPGQKNINDTTTYELKLCTSVGSKGDCSFDQMTHTFYNLLVSQCYVTEGNCPEPEPEPEPESEQEPEPTP